MAKHFNATATAVAARIDDGLASGEPNNYHRSREVLIVPNSANSDTVFVGDENTQNIPLDAGDSGIVFPAHSLGEIWIRSASGSQTVNCAYTV